METVRHDSESSVRTLRQVFENTESTKRQYALKERAVALGCPLEGVVVIDTASPPLALEVALAVQDELNARAEEVDRLRHQQVERARYEAELAQRRYLRVNPRQLAGGRLPGGRLEPEAA